MPFHAHATIQEPENTTEQNKKTDMTKSTAVDKKIDHSRLPFEKNNINQKYASIKNQNKAFHST